MLRMIRGIKGFKGARLQLRRQLIAGNSGLQPSREYLSLATFTSGSGIHSLYFFTTLNVMLDGYCAE